MATDLARELEDRGWRDEAVIEAAMQEWTEACMLLSIVRDEPLPSPKDLAVTAEAYIMGLGDVVGEVRRLAVSALGHGSVEEAEAHLQTMDLLTHALMRFEFPRSVLPMKPKQDMARSLLERTRGEVEMARFMRRFAPPGGKRSKTKLD
jgi:translin